jgi:hypothetical protein
MMLNLEPSRKSEESTLPPGAHRLIAELIVKRFEQRDVASDFGGAGA